MKSITKLFAGIVILSMMVTLSAVAVPMAFSQVDTSIECTETSEADYDVTLFGEGTQESPYEISSTVEFNNYSSLIKSNNSVYGSKYYKLTSNVDFSGVSLVPFGTDTCPFTGVFDGNGYALTNVTINNVVNSGVIGYMTAGTVKNLSVLYKDMTSRKNYSTLRYFGGIVGHIVVASSKTVTIEGCHTDGDILINDSSSVYVGGIVGRVKTEVGNMSAINCVSHMSFDAVTVGDSYAGGFVAYAIASSAKDYSFKNCVSYGDVKLISNNIDSNTAGFAAYVNKDEPGWSGWASDEETAELAAATYNFENCAALGSVYSESPSNVYVGGFIGKTDGGGTVALSKIYKNASQTVGGSVGQVTVNTLGTATANLNAQDFYSSTLGYDFSNIWYMSQAEDVLLLRTVAKSLGGSDVADKKDLRLDSAYPGLRFKASIDTFKRDYCFEYGFIVARKDELGNQELTFDYTGRIAKGVAFDSTTDMFLEKDDETITFTGVVHSIPKESYDIELVARVYVKFVCDGETVIVYGNTTSSSIYLSADAVKNSDYYEMLTAEQKQVLETMLPTA